MAFWATRSLLACEPGRRYLKAKVGYSRPRYRCAIITAEEGDIDSSQVPNALAAGGQIAAHCPYEFKTNSGSSHGLVARMLTSLRAGARVLDVGAATGMLGSTLRGRRLNLYGLEPCPEWAAMARLLYREILCSTLSEASDDFLSGFDAVVCADVLEHLAWPEQDLTRLVSLQDAGCRFVVSVPNVANLWMRVNLALGRFDYAPRGILDSSHLRFFTHRTLVKMLADAGLAVERIAPTPIPLELVNPFFRNNVLGRAAAGLLGVSTRALPTLLGYQLVALARKP